VPRIAKRTPLLTGLMIVGLGGFSILMAAAALSCLLICGVARTWVRLRDFAASAPERRDQPAAPKGPWG